LRVFSARPHHGLLRIDVMPDSRRGHAPLLLCAVVLADSGAARALRCDWSEALTLQSGSAKRIAFVKSTQDLARDLAHVLDVLAAHEQRAFAASEGEPMQAHADASPGTRDAA
jgi:hypothetical protein